MGGVEPVWQNQGFSPKLRKSFASVSRDAHLMVEPPFFSMAG
jgi:hypothetical protein